MSTAEITLCQACGGFGTDYSYGAIDVVCGVCGGRGEIVPPDLADDLADALAREAASEAAWWREVAT